LGRSRVGSLPRISPVGGQLLSGSFTDDAMPRAEDFPAFTTGFQHTPAPSNVLGAKGAGESGTVGAPPAIVAAVLGAGPARGRDVDVPLTPFRVWSAIATARASAGTS
jgi:carbon-monoxide dehydrogenase large subunit